MLSVKGVRELRLRPEQRSLAAVRRAHLLWNIAGLFRRQKGSVGVENLPLPVRQNEDHRLGKTCGGFPEVIRSYGG